MITELGKQLFASIPSTPFDIAREAAILGPALRQFIDQGIPFEKKEFKEIQTRRRDEEKDRKLFVGF
jgi:hypothetical protein